MSFTHGIWGIAEFFVIQPNTFIMVIMILWFKLEFFPIYAHDLGGVTLSYPCLDEHLQTNFYVCLSLEY